MEAVYSSERASNVYQTTRRHIPEDRRLCSVCSCISHDYDINSDYATKQHYQSGLCNGEGVLAVKYKLRKIGLWVHHHEFPPTLTFEALG
jgi:hypothetical protein